METKVSSIKILRLKTGVDLIADVEVDHGLYHLYDPMEFEMVFRNKKASLQMGYWLPIQLIKTNEVTIPAEEVLTQMIPNDDMVDYYKDTVLRLKELTLAKETLDNLSNKDMELAFDSMEHSGLDIKH